MNESEPKKVTTFMGKDLNEMTREELIDAIETMTQLYREVIEAHSRKADSQRKQKTPDLNALFGV